MNLKALLFSFLLTFGYFQYSKAEYRVFLLKISKVGATPESQDFRLVESTLDPAQYRGYYDVGLDEELVYIDTWRCYGRTDGFRPLCPNPKTKAASDTKDQIPSEVPSTP